MDFPRGTDSARVIKVIETVAIRGSGTSANDMCRPVTQYWSLSGKLLAENDPCNKEEQISIKAGARGGGKDVISSR